MFEDRLLNIASSLMRDDFMRAIQPILKEKCKVMNISPLSCIWTIDKNNKAMIYDREYPPKVQDIFDKCDEMIEAIRASYSSEEVKRKFIIKARKILDRLEYKNTDRRMNHENN